MMFVLTSEVQQTIRLVWDRNKTSKLQHFIWQLNSGGLPWGSWAALAGFPGNCRICNAGLPETPEHLLLGCRFARRTWRRCEAIRKALDLPERISWREIITGVAPGTMGQSGPRPCRRKPNVAWDVFRATVLWQIWCARCNMVFANEPMNSFQIYLRAWRNTIMAGMARRSTILKTLHCSSESKQANIAKEFSDSWCKNSVFCSGGLKSAKWYLTPGLVDCVPALHWDGL
jgi:hypothetical protein